MIWHGGQAGNKILGLFDIMVPAYPPYEEIKTTLSPYFYSIFNEAGQTEKLKAFRMPHPTNLSTRTKSKRRGFLTTDLTPHLQTPSSTSQSHQKHAKS